ncbi:MAG: hypothetical protein M1832_000849 [Thelocarpon impressellum]|nr:MAG: hypothetical protein M1832_000849 [Thelocarpon impressellum]
MRSSFTSAISAVLVLLFAICLMGPTQTSALTIPTLDSLSVRSLGVSSGLDVSSVFGRSAAPEANPAPAPAPAAKKGKSSGSSSSGGIKKKAKFPKGAIVGIVIAVIVIIIVVLVILYLRRRKARQGAIAR